MSSNISIIIVLYKTNLNRIKYLNKIKNHSLLIFEQKTNKSREKQIKKYLNFKFKYFYSEKNIGLSKAMNYLIKKIKTKYCLLVEPDIKIDNSSIKILKSLVNKKNCLFVGPSYKKNKSKKPYFYTNKFDFSCLIFDVKKVKKFSFYDEDFSFYWEDIDLLTRVNNSKYKMIVSNRAFAIHNKSQSTENSFVIKILKLMNFKYGELVYGYKYKTLSKIKVLRHLYLCPLRMIIYFIFFNQKKFLLNLSYFLGTLKFLKFLIKKI
tara:strand:+ start:106 stop:897 length:792 start_codon:yes stop_codon:yes gene_type:complete